MYGHVDIANSFEVFGWAVQADRQTADRVALEVDGREVAQIPCYVFRKDLRDIGLGDGYCGFRFLFPDCLGLYEAATLTVRAMSTGQPLAPGPLIIGNPLEEVARVKQAEIDPAYACIVHSATPKEGKLILEGTALAPPAAALTIVPATDFPGGRITSFEVGRVDEIRLGDWTARHSHFRAVVEVKPQTERKILGFDLIDQNQPGIGGPINPVSRIAIPSTTGWMTIPGEQHIVRTSGSTSVQRFSVTGVSTAFQIRSIIDKYFESDRTITILDWGVGCARVAVPLKRVMRPDARVIGVDVDEVNVAWCRENLNDIEIGLCDFFPPLELEPNSIDVIYGISVMTHLTDAAQFVWLREIRRMLKPEGICILTTHGEPTLGIRRIRDPLILRDLIQYGISDRTHDMNLGDKLSLKGYYRATYQLRQEVEDAWSKHLSIEAYYPAGNEAFQDLIVLRKA